MQMGCTCTKVISLQLQNARSQRVQGCKEKRRRLIEEIEKTDPLQKLAYRVFY